MNLDSLKEQYGSATSSPTLSGIIDVTWAPRQQTSAPPDNEVLLACGGTLHRDSGTWYITYNKNSGQKWSSDPMARHIGAIIVEAELLPYMGNVSTPIAITQLLQMGRIVNEGKPTGIMPNGLTAPVSAVRSTLQTPSSTLSALSGQLFVPRMDATGLEKQYHVLNVLLSSNATSYSGMLAAIAMTANPISKEMLARAKQLPTSALTKGKLPIANQATGLAIVVRDGTAMAHLAKGLISPSQEFSDVFNATFGTSLQLMPSASYKVAISDVMASTPMSFLDTTMCPAWLKTTYGPTAEAHQGKPLDQNSQMGTLILLNPQVTAAIAGARLGSGGSGYSIYI